MKKRNKIILALLGVLIFGGVSNNPTKEVLANSSEEISSSEVIESSTNETVITEEQMEEIVKNISNKIIGEELTDKLFGMFGFGIIAILLVYVVFQINERLKNKKVGEVLVKNSSSSFQKISGTLDDLIHEVESYKKIVETLQKENTKLAKEDNERVKNMIELTEGMQKDYNELIKTLKVYQKLETKVNKIIEIEKEYTNNPTNVSLGISEKVNKLIEEVDNNEEN